MLYLLIGFGATALGALVGVGGGLVIRPLLAFLGVNKELASFTSSAAVLAMAAVTLLTYRRKHVKIEIHKTGFMAAGSVAGGFLGGGLIPLVSNEAINIGYIVVLGVVAVLAVFKNKLVRKREVGKPGAVVIGGISGVLSGIFGIGGGPFQMAALMICFRMRAKDAAVQSIFITLLTTASALARYAISGAWDFSIAVYMIPTAVVGGIVGGLLNRKMRSPVVRVLFVATLAAMMALQMVTVLTGK